MERHGDVIIRARLRTDLTRQTATTRKEYHSSHIGGEEIRLIGPGGAGKSTIGILVAERLGFAFLDFDIYMAVPARTIETMRPLKEVVDEITSALSREHAGGVLADARAR